MNLASLAFFKLFTRFSPLSLKKTPISIQNYFQQSCAMPEDSILNEPLMPSTRKKSLGMSETVPRDLKMRV